MKKNFFAAIILAGMMSAARTTALLAMPACGPFPAAMAAVQQDEKTVVSPDGKTFLKVGLKGDGQPYYKVGYYAEDKDGKKEVMMGQAYQRNPQNHQLLKMY